MVRIRIGCGVIADRSRLVAVVRRFVLLECGISHWRIDLEGEVYVLQVKQIDGMLRVELCSKTSTSQGLGIGWSRKDLPHQPDLAPLLLEQGPVYFGILAFWQRIHADAIYHC